MKARLRKHEERIREHVLAGEFDEAGTLAQKKKIDIGRINDLDRMVFEKIRKLINANELKEMQELYAFAERHGLLDKHRDEISKFIDVWTKDKILIE